MARNENGKGFSLKDELFNRKKVTWLAKQFKASDKKFDEGGFVRDVMQKLTKLELKDRIKHIAAVLENYLDADFTVAAKQLKAVLPPPLDPTKTDNDFGDFILAPLGEYVVQHGLTKKHCKLSLALLKELTKRFSMEDAIRYFINEFPDVTMTELTKWAGDENYHVRRLVSEGTRPLLPWSGRINLDQTSTLPLLDTLHADRARYVTRSVANHLNDISKSDPTAAVTAIKRWRRLKLQNEKELEWMTKHGLRTLIKQGNAEALALLGYQKEPSIIVSPLVLGSKSITPGQHLEFSFTVTASEACVLLVDYQISFARKDKSRHKVFKFTTVRLQKGERIKLTKKHLFVKDPTTLRYYAGSHHLTIQINGSLFSNAAFKLDL